MDLDEQIKYNNETYAIIPHMKGIKDMSMCGFFTTMV